MSSRWYGSQRLRVPHTNTSSKQSFWRLVVHNKQETLKSQSKWYQCSSRQNLSQNSQTLNIKYVISVRVFLSISYLGTLSSLNPNLCFVFFFFLNFFNLYTTQWPMGNLIEKYLDNNKKIKKLYIFLIYLIGRSFI